MSHGYEAYRVGNTVSNCVQSLYGDNNGNKKLIHVKLFRWQPLPLLLLSRSSRVRLCATP